MTVAILCWSEDELGSLQLGNAANEHQGIFFGAFLQLLGHAKYTAIYSLRKITGVIVIPLEEEEI